MARRKRRKAVRRHRVNTHRRRRRVAVARVRRRRAHEVNPRRRRRHRSNPVIRHHRRRRHHRNPGFGLGFLLQGAKDGAVIAASMVANRKVAGLLSSYVPGLSLTNSDGSVNLVGLAGSRIASATALGFLSRKFAPGLSRQITGAAFADAILATLANVPSVAPMLGATPVVRPAIRPGVSGWTRSVGAGKPGVGAWSSRRVGLPTQVG
jgi:hypothetical protein